MSLRHAVTVAGYEPFEAAEGQRLLEACEDAGLPIDAACGGFACCNTCRVEVEQGADHLSDRLPEEEPFLDAVAQRLSCQATVHGPVVVRLAPGE
ncbi:MAG: (2Fe-2S)-binding protein [Myxococcales bacterium]|nr:(2Fe-2S)-binding protein [Myxococcales bacterium]